VAGQHLHLVGISGSLMAGAAVLAGQLGYKVSGSDRDFSPPMGNAVKASGAELFIGYDATVHDRPADCYIIGNAVSRGNPLVESILSNGRPHKSAAQWISEEVLSGKKVLAVAGTHGKTTTASLLAWMLSQAGMEPGFLLGGIAQNFNASAHLGKGEWFVIEADEYDSAFFDKRPKFMHYYPQVALLNNLEFDHADIYNSVEEIALQFHYLLRLIPAEGHVIARAGSSALQSAIDRGIYSGLSRFAPRSETDCEWQWEYANGFMTVLQNGEVIGEFTPPLAGAANRDNITGAFAAAFAAGVSKDQLVKSIEGFQPPLRRLQKIHDNGGAVLYDDFAHHPTAYRTVLAAAREEHPDRRLVAVFEPRSNTMKAGVLCSQLPGAFADAARVIAVGSQDWLPPALESLGDKVTVCPTADEARQLLKTEIQSDDCVIFMSNGSFDRLPQLVAEDCA